MELWDLGKIPYVGEIFSLGSAVLWAFAVIMFKRSGESVHPMSLNLFKNLLAVLLFLLTFQFIGQEIIIPEISNYDLLLIFISGGIGIGLADTLFFQCLNKLGASLTAIIDCFYAPFVILFSFLWLGETLTIIQVLGAALILTAIVTATYNKDNLTITRRDKIVGIIYGFLAMLMMAVGVVIIKPVLNNYPLLWVTEMRLLSGVVVLLISFLFIPNRRKILKSMYYKVNWKYLLTGSFIGAYLAMMTWLAGIKYTQVSTAAALNQTNNIFIFIFAALILKEKITKHKLIGIVAAVSGAFLVTFG